jgi:hypothetical protein
MVWVMWHGRFRRCRWCGLFKNISVVEMGELIRFASNARGGAPLAPYTSPATLVGVGAAPHDGTHSGRGMLKKWVGGSVRGLSGPHLPFAFGLFAGIAELQLVGQPIQQPSLNQRHWSPVQNAPLLCQLASS